MNDRHHRLCLLGLLALSTPAAFAQPPAEVTETVVVTGTREADRHARDSLSPIEVIGARELEATGQSSVLDALHALLPSLGTPAVGYDVGALARSFQLRGLSPAHTLVLVNGKRRHASASLYADSDPAQGANAVDLDLIPIAAIDHVEVLQDGAAAQYGSDAIAGVVNILLKDDKEGGTVTAGGGRYLDGGGGTGTLDADAGFALGADGHLHLAAGLRRHGFSNRSADSGGPQPALVQGDPSSRLATASFDYGNKLAADLSTYGFGTFAHRTAAAWENPRQPGWISDAVDALHPRGFTPQERIRENDFSLTGGFKGRALEAWSWDLSLTCGHDRQDLRNVDTLNPDLLADQGDAQSGFDVGGFESSDLTLNLDLKRPVAVAGLAGPLNVAWGLQARRETFRIRSGEPSSFYLGGSQAFPGFRPNDATDASRGGAAAYVDLQARVTAAWELGVAARAENTHGVGDDVAGKLSTRLALSPALSWRATVSNGFHAPTLPQQHYSATTVTTGFAQIQLPLGSPGAEVLGAPGLRPETSRSVSTGLVFEPVPGLHGSLDAWQVDIDDRILQSASLAGDLALQAIRANGVSLPAGVDGGGVSAAFFTNGVDTRTRGVDLALDQRLDLAALGRLDWRLAAGYAATTLRRVHAAPGALDAAGLTLVDAVQRSNLTTATPRAKVSLSGALHTGAWTLTLRETFYGATRQTQGYAPGPFYSLTTNPAFLTDVDVRWAATDRWTLEAGVDNLFNRRPNEIPIETSRALNYDRYSHVAPYGINGGYGYARVSFAF